MYYLQNEWLFFYQYIKTRVPRTSIVCTLIKNGYEFCKLLLKRTQIVLQLMKNKYI